MQSHETLRSDARRMQGEMGNEKIGSGKVELVRKLWYRMVGNGVGTLGGRKDDMRVQAKISGFTGLDFSSNRAITIVPSVARHSSEPVK